MADVVRIKGFDVVSARLQGIKAFRGSQTLMELIGSTLQQNLLKRTAGGVDVSGRPFEPYSASWKKVREKVGLPTSQVDLFFSGSMLGAMTYTATKLTARVFFMDTAGTSQGYGSRSSSVTNAEKALYNQERRDFFGMSAEDVNEATELAREWVKTLLKG